jgi:hypothetical protein
VSENKINFAMKDKNPLELTHFYYTEGNKERIPQKRVSAMMPDTFQDVKFRVYSKSRDRSTVEALNTAFRSWVSGGPHGSVDLAVDGCAWQHVQRKLGKQLTTIGALAVAAARLRCCFVCFACPSAKGSNRIGEHLPKGCVQLHISCLHVSLNHPPPRCAAAAQVKKHLPKDVLDTSGRGSPDLEEHMTPLPGKKRQRAH